MSKSPKALQVAPDALTDKSLGPDGCWLWTGRINDGGYGCTKDSTLSAGELVHRLAWELSTGKDAGVVLIRHSCDNRKCVNPSHLLDGTSLMNSRDAQRRGRLAPPDGRKLRCMATIQRRQAAREEWADAHEISPDDLLGLSKV